MNGGGSDQGPLVERRRRPNSQSIGIQAEPGQFPRIVIFIFLLLGLRLFYTYKIFL